MMNNIEGKSGGNESFAEFRLKAAEKRYGKKRWVRWGWIGSSVLLMLMAVILILTNDDFLGDRMERFDVCGGLFFARLFIFS